MPTIWRQLFPCIIFWNYYVGCFVHITVLLSRLWNTLNIINSFTRWNFILLLTKLYANFRNSKLTEYAVKNRNSRTWILVMFSKAFSSNFGCKKFYVYVNYENTNLYYLKKILCSPKNHISNKLLSKYCYLVRWNRLFMFYNNSSRVYRTACNYWHGRICRINCNHRWTSHQARCN